MRQLQGSEALLLPMKSVSFQRMLYKHPLFRFFPLILFLLYCAVSALRLPRPPPHPDHIAVVAEGGSSLRTHIRAGESLLLQAREDEKDSCSTPPCSSFINGDAEVEAGRNGNQRGFLCCDRSHYRTDICYMKGDVRTHSPSSSILLYDGGEVGEERIRPYTRKWEAEVMRTVDELRLRPANGSATDCEVKHEVPAVVFSTGGYTGNVYHEFNDGLLPLYLTVARFGGEVVVVAVEFHDWWLSKYRSVVKKLSNYPVVDFGRDRRVHCFPEVIVGLRIQGELSVVPSLSNGKSIRDFRALVAEGLQKDYRSHHNAAEAEAEAEAEAASDRPLLVILIRNNTRVLLNLRETEKACRAVGFRVAILNPQTDTQLADIFAVLNSAAAMIGVHGAAMTHFLFMKPGAVLIQIVPLGLSWAAEEYYGRPARELGLHYTGYNISPAESSLSEEYGTAHPVVVDPGSVNSKGWSETKRVYLEKQNVRVDVQRLRRVLVKAYSHVVMSTNRHRPLA